MASVVDTQYPVRVYGYSGIANTSDPIVVASGGVVGGYLSGGRQAPLVYRFGQPAPGNATDRIVTARQVVVTFRRVATTTTSTYVLMRVTLPRATAKGPVNLPVGVAPQQFEFQVPAGASGTTTTWTQTFTGDWNSSLGATCDIEVALTVDGPADRVGVADVKIQVTYDWAIAATTPITVVTGPTGVLDRDESAQVRWQVNGNGGAQRSYRVRVFTSAQYGIGGFDPAVSPSTWDSGVILLATQSATVPVTLDVTLTYRAYVMLDMGGTTTTAWTFSQWSYSSAGSATLATSSQATARPLVTWVFVAGTAGRGQERVQVQVSNPSGGAIEYDSGTVYQSATTFAIPVSLPYLGGTNVHNVRVRVAERGGDWSAYTATSAYTLTYTAGSGTPSATGVTATASVTLSHTASGTNFVSWERSIDAGTTWVAVTGATDLSVVGNGSASDYEAPIGVSTLWRFRIDSHGGGLFTPSAWASPGAVTPATAAYWVKCPDTPALNTAVRVLVASGISMTGNEPQAVVFSAGASNPLVLAGPVGGERFSLAFDVTGLAGARALDALRAARTRLLFQTDMAARQWYVRCLTSTRTLETSRVSPTTAATTQRFRVVWDCIEVASA